jgi:hypothetical protein
MHMDTDTGYTVQYYLMDGSGMEDWHPSEQEALRSIHDYYLKVNQPPPPRRVYPNGVFEIGGFRVIPDQFIDEDAFVDYPPFYPDPPTSS